MANREKREPRKLRHIHHRVLNRVKRLVKHSKRGVLVKVLAAMIAFSATTSIKAMEPETKQHFNKVAEYTIQMQDVVNNQLNFQFDSEQFKQSETVVDSLKSLQTKEVDAALEGYFTDTFVYFLEGNTSQVEMDIKALRNFATEIGDGELQKGVNKWTNYMEDALNAKNSATDHLSSANSHYDNMTDVNNLLKQAFKETKDFGVLDGYVSLNSMGVLQKSADQIINNAYNEHYDNVVGDLDILQHLFDQVPEKTSLYEDLINKTRFATVKKIMSNATHHIESDRQEVAVNEIEIAKKIDKKITEYMMPTVLESMTNEIIKTADSGDYETAKKQIKFLDKKFDSKKTVENVNNKIGESLLKQAKSDFSKSNYSSAFDKLLEAEEFMGENQKDLRKSMSHILEKKGQTELAKKFEEETSKKGFSKLKFWK